MKVKKIYGDGREEVVESRISRRQLEGLNCGNCSEILCDEHKCPMHTGDRCFMFSFLNGGGKLEEVPELMISPNCGEDIGLVAVKRVPVLMFASVRKEELADFSKYKNIVSASVDVGTNNVTVFYWE